MTRIPFQRILVVLGLAALAAAAQYFLLPHKQVEADANTITLAEARAMKGPVLWVDARSRAAFDAAHVPGAVLLNNLEWDTLAPAFLDVWESGVTIIVYCDGGACTASHDVANRIRNEFAPDGPVLVLTGGWQAWQDSN